LGQLDISALVWQYRIPLTRNKFALIIEKKAAYISKSLITKEKTTLKKCF
jgi:hypothetical protein|tara:strand:- start:295 stop:444 length:150 start_codon:yes stop_codon:yes gene_type:complete